MRQKEKQLALSTLAVKRAAASALKVSGALAEDNRGLSLHFAAWGVLLRALDAEARQQDKTPITTAELEFLLSESRLLAKEPSLGPLGPTERS